MKKISFESLKGLSKNMDGPTDAEVASQRSIYGKNEIVEVAGNPWWELARDTLKDPMIWFLLGIGTVFILTGDTSEAIVLLLAIVPLLSMDAILHWRTQASTSGLKAQLATQVKVLRGGKEAQVDTRDLVPGDILAISAGTFIPADGVFQEATELQIDESVLTGEALPIQKKRYSLDPFDFVSAGEISVDPSTLGMAGTRVLTGQGRLRVLLTGRRTYYGEIVQSVSSMPHERTPLQKSIARLVQRLVLGAAAFCLALLGVRLYQGHGWKDALLSAATLAVAAIPEEFPVVFTFFLGIGVYRLAKRRALVRQAVSVENIGRVTYICTDKTGTLTIGDLKLAHIDPADGIPESQVLQAGLTASNPKGSDPVDLAIQAVAQQKSVEAWARTNIFPFTEDRKRETVIALETAFMKGAPETVIGRTTLLMSQRQNWMERASKWANEGHKVLGLARKRITPQTSGEQIEPQENFEFLGLFAFEDPARPEVAEAMDYCRENGIGVLMLTGDHPGTAGAIAREVGLGRKSPVIFCAETNPEKLQDPSFLKEVDVVARCTPLQKLEIVNVLKRAGELVAVTGDGVNDVPALKAADIGIAMGQRGTRSAKEVSSIILADDNFRTIVSAIMEGRKLFKNLKASFEYLLLIHIPLVLTAALVPLFGHPLIYLPVHIVWLELIIHPTALFAFQESASASHETPAERAGGKFFPNRDAIRVALVGVAFAAFLGLSYIHEEAQQPDIGHARAKALAMLTLWSAGLVMYFTRLQTRASQLVTFCTVVSSCILIQWPLLATGPLHLSPLHLIDWAMASGTVMTMVLILAFIRCKKRAVYTDPT